MLVFYLESCYELQILFKCVQNKFYIYTFEKNHLLTCLSLFQIRYGNYVSIHDDTDAFK